MSPDPASTRSPSPTPRRSGLRRVARLGLALATSAWLGGCIVVPSPYHHPHYRTGGVVVVPSGNEVVRVWDGGVVRREPRSWRGERYRGGRGHDDD